MFFEILDCFFITGIGIVIEIGMGVIDTVHGLDLGQRLSLIVDQDLVHGQDQRGKLSIIDQAMNNKMVFCSVVNLTVVDITCTI